MLNDDLTMLNEAMDDVRTKIVPKLKMLVEPYFAINFANYVAGIGRVPLDELPYKYYHVADATAYSLDFLDRYADKSVGFCTMNSDDRGKWGWIRAIYQIEPDLHVQIGIYVVQDNGERHLFICHSSLMSTDISKMWNFIDSNTDLRYNSTQRKIGLGFNLQ